MNEFQRQLLADRLDEIGRRKESYEKAIVKLEHQLSAKKARYEELLNEESKLIEGIDW